MPTLVVRHPDGSERAHALSSELKVGRQEGTNDLVLAESSVSRRHCRFFVEDGKVLVEDMGSVNGTFVDGQRITDATALTPKSQVLLGDYALRIEAPAPRTATSAASLEAVRPAGPRERLLGVAASVVGLLVVAGIVQTVTGGGAGGGQPVRKAAPPPNPQEEVQELLSRCRSFSSMESGSEPEWEKAEAACSKALDLEPINSEANGLMRRIKVEKEAANAFAQGSKALTRLKEEEALEHFKRIPKDSSYFRRARPKVLELVAQVMKRSQDDCKRYLRDSQWSAAVPRCERYLGFACQKMTREELEPPIGFTLVLDRHKRLGRTEWRPMNKLYLDFLLARRKLDANAFKQRLPNKLLVAAMMDYWAGRGNEAIVTLQKLRSNDELAPYHGDADELLADVSNVDQLFKIGQSHLQNEDVEKAAEPLLEALDVDKRLMADLADTRPSFYRLNTQQAMASKAIVRGKLWDERGDPRHACRIWKLGFRFYAGNTDLNAQVGRCSTLGLEALETAQSCEDLAAVLDFAVPGDGLEDKVQALKKERGC
jgi:hypothetical protein